MKYLGSSSKMIKLAALVVMASSVLLSASAEHHAIAGNYGNEDVKNKVADDDHSSALLANNTEHPNAVSDGGLRGVFHQGRGDETQSEASAREVSKFRSQPELEETKSKREDNAEFEFAEAHVGITSEGNGGAGFKALALVGPSSTEAARDADEDKLSTRDHTSPLGRDGSHTAVALNGGRVLASKNCDGGGYNAGGYYECKKHNTVSCDTTKQNEECISGNCNRTTRYGDYQCCASTWYCWAWTSGCSTGYNYCEM